MEKEKSYQYNERLEQSTDAVLLVEAAFTTSETPEEAVTQLAILLAQERRIRHAYEDPELVDKLIHLEAQNQELMYDELGLERKKQFEEDITAALARVNRNPDFKIAIGLGDADFLKEVNDTISHFAGDRFLQESVAGIKSQLRTGDTLYRLGGDEFVGIFYDMDEVAADNFQIRMRRALEISYSELAKEFDGNPHMSTDFQRLLDKIKVPFTFSFGMAFIAPNDSLESVMTRADKDMYEQKRIHKRRADNFYPIE